MCIPEKMTSVFCCPTHVEVLLRKLYLWKTVCITCAILLKATTMRSPSHPGPPLAQSEICR